MTRDFPLVSLGGLCTIAHLFCHVLGGTCGDAPGRYHANRYVPRASFMSWREGRNRAMRSWSLAIGVVCITLLASMTLAEETPRYGGTLRVAIAAEPPSLDPHQETTFAIMMTAAPVYNTLLQFSPTDYPNIVGDLAESWAISEDGLTYT